MKLKDLIGIIPDNEGVWIGGEYHVEFNFIPFELFKRDVRVIKESNWGGVLIELQDCTPEN